MMGHPFDAAAVDYDAQFTDVTLGRWLRDRVRAHLPFEAGQHVLDLGCGTGEDAVWMAGQGIRVTAADASSGMLAQAQHKVRAGGLYDAVQTATLDINMPTSLPGVYDGVLANFGVVNVAEDLSALAHFLSDCLRSGSSVILVVMGPTCLWETSWYLLHGKPRDAFRRWNRQGIPAHVGEGETIHVWYPSPRTLRRAFAPYFGHIQTVGIGTLLPPSYLSHLVERHPGTFKRLAVWDRRLERLSLAAYVADHYVMMLRRL